MDLNVAEPVEEHSTVDAEDTAPRTEDSGSGQAGATHGASGAARSARRRLDPEQEREIARLYADGTSTAAICERFGIGQSSLYRIVQRQGISLRGRGASSAPAAPSPRSAPTRQQRRSISAGQPAPGQPRPTGAAAGRSRRGAAPRGPRAPVRPSPAGRAAAPSDGVVQRFRIAYAGETVIEAQDVRDALRQVESLGATEIVAVSRID